MNVGNAIKDYLDRTGKSPRWLAEKTGIPLSSIYRLQEQESCRLTTWAKLEAVIKPRVRFRRGEGAAA